MRVRYLMGLVLGLVLTSAVLASPQSARPTGTRPTVTVYSPPGRSRAGFEARVDPYAPGQPLVVTVGLIKTDVRDQRGAVVSAMGFYGWAKDKVVRLRVFALVPGPNAPNRYLYNDRELIPLLVPRDFSDLSLSVGQTVKLDGMKAWGFEPMEVRVTDGPPKR